MAYITRCNFDRLTASDRMLAMQGSEKLVYAKQRIDWFSDWDLTRLYLCKILMTEQDHVLFQKMVGQHWLRIRTEDPYTHAVPPRKPAYHSDPNCECLKSDCQNFKLPVGFKEKYGIAEVERFRDWLNTRQEDGKTPWAVFESAPERFKAKCEAIWTRVSWHHMVLEKHKNSGIQIFHNFQVSEIEAFIENLLVKFQEWQNTLSLTEQRAINAHKKRGASEKMSFQGLEQEDLDALLNEFRKQFKFPMQNALMAYYYQMAQENKMLGVSHSVLQKLGFKACEACGGSHDDVGEWG